LFQVIDPEGPREELRFVGFLHLVKFLEQVFGDGMLLYLFEEYFHGFLYVFALFVLLSYLALVLILVDRRVNQEG
jgi:hypothetical protein